jgi:hypothetical protein
VRIVSTHRSSSVLASTLSRSGFVTICLLVERRDALRAA